jgi:hypothetical protein
MDCVEVSVTLISVIKGFAFLLMSTVTHVKNIFQTYLSSSTESAFEKLLIIPYSFDRKYFLRTCRLHFPLRILRESIAIEHYLYSIVLYMSHAC